jgi:hypothetical protein
VLAVLVLAVMASAACEGLTADPGVTRDAVTDRVIKLTRERPTTDLTITLRADAGALRGHSAATAYVLIHPARAANPANVEIELRHSATGLPPPDWSGPDEDGDFSFTAFASCSSGACEEPWGLTITWDEPRDTAFLNVEVGVILSVRYGEEASPPPDGQIGVTIE